MVVCHALNCKNATKDGYHLFKFPSAKNDRDRREIWRKNSGKTDLRDNGEYRLCEIHFERNLIYKRNDRFFLVDGAIPTIFPSQTTSESVDAEPINFCNNVIHDHKYAKKWVVQIPFVIL